MLHARFPRRSIRALALVAGVALTGIGDAHAQSGTFGTDQRYCDNSALGKVLSTSKGNLIGSAAGGAAGGLIGNQFGKSEGKGVMTVLGVIGGAPANQPVAWQNPGTGSSYWVTPSDDRNGPRGEKCRNFVTDAVVNGRPTKTQSTACRQPDGAWVPVSTQTLEPLKPRPLQSGGALSDDTVLKVQQRLHEQGFYVRDNIDGQWGPSTASAVKNFQRSKGMKPTGQLDIDTLTALDLGSDQGQPARN
jgi:surface antigen